MTPCIIPRARRGVARRSILPSCGCFVGGLLLAGSGLLGRSSSVALEPAKSANQAAPGTT